jgi:hypothetical protein
MPTLLAKPLTACSLFALAWLASGQQAPASDAAPARHPAPAHLAPRPDEDADMPPEHVSDEARAAMMRHGALEALADAMEAAVKTGDIPSYLRLIDVRDPIFATEQRNWAKDLAEKPPTSIEITLSAPASTDVQETRRELAVQDAATTPLAPHSLVQRITFAWTQPADNAGNAAFERTVAFDARFNLIEGIWKYAGEDWLRVETDHAIVLHDPGLEEVAANAASAFEKIQTRVLEGFELSDAPIATRKQVIKLYKDMKHLQHSIYLSYPFPLGGWNEPGESIKILAGRRSSEAALKGLLAHEFGHVCTFELGPKANEMPWWILEGVAELSISPFDRHIINRAQRTVRRWNEAGTLQAWKDLTDFRTVPADLHGHVYTQGMHMVWYVSDRFGREGRLKWMRAMADGKTLDQATLETLGIGFEQLDREWRATLNQSVPDDESRDE